MIKLHNLGFPRIGVARELKSALERYWSGSASASELQRRAAELRTRHWSLQAGLDAIPVGDFSLYDHVLDTSALLGNLPPRALTTSPLDSYFRAARGRSAPGSGAPIAPAEMTKWFDTNYHYLVPEFERATQFALQPDGLLAQLREAMTHPAVGAARVKPVLLGPVSYLALGKSRDGTPPLQLLPRLLPVYGELLQALAAAGASWVQVDEPLLATDLAPDWQHAFRLAYHTLQACGVRILLATYFGPLLDNAYLAANLPVAGLHLDAVRGRADALPLINLLAPHKVLSLGVVDGRNVWCADLTALLEWLEPLAQRLGARLWLAPSCSLLHVPVDLRQETRLSGPIAGALAFAVQKLDELRILGRALNEGRAAIADALEQNRAALAALRADPRLQVAAVRAATAAIAPGMGARASPYPERAARQRARLALPTLPTTTIGSFPQTPAIRRARAEHRAGHVDAAAYEAAMREEIARCVRAQEELGLDVLVHGEAERNDMVEYFAEHLDGYLVTDHGWVQSYGSRCVKPPILYGDVERPRPITVGWASYAQSLTAKPVKGMLTGPVTMLNWSFVRDDLPRAEVCRQLALAIRAEVLDLERAGIGVIQIDEPALREGLPLRRAQREEYLVWAVACFRVAANGVRDETQIHTHMCYSEFNDIMPAIAALDADVITIETARSDMDLLAAFERFEYPNEIGPGVYDIHSPNVPHEAEIEERLRRAARQIPLARLWVNPDCGLKTRRWEEVLPALQAMVAAARRLRAEAGAASP